MQDPSEVQNSQKSGFRHAFAHLAKSLTGKNQDQWDRWANKEIKITELIGRKTTKAEKEKPQSSGRQLRFSSKFRANSEIRGGVIDNEIEKNKKSDKYAAKTEEYIGKLTQKFKDINKTAIPDDKLRQIENRFNSTNDIINGKKKGSTRGIGKMGKLRETYKSLKRDIIKERNLEIVSSFLKNLGLSEDVLPKNVRSEIEKIYNSQKACDVDLNKKFPEVGSKLKALNSKGYIQYSKKIPESISGQEVHYFGFSLPKICQNAPQIEKLQQSLNRGIAVPKNEIERLKEEKSNFIKNFAFNLLSSRGLIDVGCQWDISGLNQSENFIWVPNGLDLNNPASFNSSKKIYDINDTNGKFIKLEDVIIGPKIEKGVPNYDKMVARFNNPFDGSEIEIDVPDNCFNAAFPKPKLLNLENVEINHVETTETKPVSPDNSPTEVNDGYENDDGNNVDEPIFNDGEDDDIVINDFEEGI